MEAVCSPSYSTSHSAPGEAAKDGPRARAPAPTWGKPGGSSKLQPSPAVAVAAIWEANQETKDFPLSFLLTLSNKLNRTHTHCRGG